MMILTNGREMPFNDGRVNLAAAGCDLHRSSKIELDLLRKVATGSLVFPDDAETTVPSIKLLAELNRVLKTYGAQAGTKVEVSTCKLSTSCSDAVGINQFTVFTVA